MGRPKVFATLAFVLFFTGAYFAACPTATRNIYLAAVTGESSGGVFRLQVELRPGNGSAYTSVSPRTGFATQDSEETAVDYAFSSTGMDRRQCDVYFRIEGLDANSTVDGPSAGGAMAVATRAALLGRQIRQDVVMTGTISPSGKVGAVGGIIEKAVGASDSGAKYFLAPALQIHEALLISAISRTKDFHVLEISSVRDAEQVLYSSYAEKFYSNYTPSGISIPRNLPPLQPDLDLSRFSKVAGRVVDKLDSKVSQVFSSGQKGTEIAGLADYFRDEIRLTRQLISLGYPFSGANQAFLLSIDAEYLKIADNKLDLQGSLKDVKACLGNVSMPQKTSENFHWAIGADLRRVWAEKKIEDDKGPDEGQDDYSVLRDYLYAYSWCGVSSELASQAGEIGGKAVNESVLAGLAQQKLSEAEGRIKSASLPDYDALWHLEAGQLAAKEGKFGAAIYDATYASSMQGAADENTGNLTDSAARLMEGQRKSLWGKVYYGQGAFLYASAQAGGFAPADSYKILKYSSELDKASAQIDQALEAQPAANISEGANVQIQQAGEGQGSGNIRGEDDFAVGMVLSLCVGLMGALAAWRSMHSME